MTTSLVSRALPPDTAKTMRIEDEDESQRERHRLKNTKRAKCRERPSVQQQQPDDLYNFSSTDLHNIINVDRDTRNIIIAKQQERFEVEAYNPTNYHIPKDYLSTTRKRKPNSPNAPDASMRQSTRGRPMLNS